jgi:DNA-binding response OmpR family regulator
MQNTTMQNRAKSAVGWYISMNHENILIIDNQQYWREFSQQALKEAGFNVLTYDTSTYLNAHNQHAQFSEEIASFPFATASQYDEEQGQSSGADALPSPTHSQPKPDLIILGCVQVGKEEQVLIERFLAAGYHLLVVSTFLSRQEMRALFLEGVSDVANKPYNANNLVVMVKVTLQSILAHNL